jgi:hypothetical protein
VRLRNRWTHGSLIFLIKYGKERNITLENITTTLKCTCIFLKIVQGSNEAAHLFFPCISLTEDVAKFMFRLLL